MPDIYNEVQTDEKDKKQENNVVPIETPTVYRQNPKYTDKPQKLNDKGAIAPAPLSLR